jgi:hypothetical protein
MSQKAITIHRPQKEPKPDKEQRRHLLCRLEVREQQLRRELGKILHAERVLRQDPPEIAAARKLVEDFDAAEEARDDAQWDNITRLRKWLNEQVLFKGVDYALQIVKAYETLSLEEAMNAGGTMEDRNDPPIGRLTHT